LLIQAAWGSLGDSGAPCSGQVGHGSPAGHSIGPPIELSVVTGSPARGCSRTTVRAIGASSGKCTVTSTGRGGVVRSMHERICPTSDVAVRWSGRRYNPPSRG
jgi:hypothetical protein